MGQHFYSPKIGYTCDTEQRHVLCSCTPYHARDFNQDFHSEESGKIISDKDKSADKIWVTVHLIYFPGETG